MRPSNYKIRVTPEQSETIQKICFARGIGWKVGGKVLQHTDMEVLYVYEDSITFRGFYSEESFNGHPNKEISAEKFIEKYSATTRQWFKTMYALPHDIYYTNNPKKDKPIYADDGSPIEAVVRTQITDFGSIVAQAPVASSATKVDIIKSRPYTKVDQFN